MTVATGNGSTQETFASYFDSWLQEQNQYLQRLVSAAKEYADGADEVADQTLSYLVNKVLQHYECYYEAKEERVEEDVLAMMSPSWVSTLEGSFLWIGGWRPSMAFHLLYSKTGLQVESSLEKLMQGLGVTDLGGLTGTQMIKIDELHKETVRKERQINEKFAKHQASAADTSMVELSNVISEVLRSGEPGNLKEEELETTLQSKETLLGKSIRKADHLRLETLKAIVGILTPIQTVHFLIACAELHLRLHDWGVKRDHDKHQA